VIAQGQSDVISMVGIEADTDADTGAMGHLIDKIGILIQDI
jgi:hypothetical protein